jgi:hypothetical protein
MCGALSYLKLGNTLCVKKVGVEATIDEPNHLGGTADIGASAG